MIITRNNQLFTVFDIDFIKKQVFHPKSLFSKDEDEKLKDLVNFYGIDNWKIVSSQMKNRNIRQYKERWFNYLMPEIKKTDWSKEEDELLLNLHSEYGPKWKQISLKISGRTDINVKNRYNLLQRRKNRIEKKKTKKETEIDHASINNCSDDSSDVQNRYSSNEKEFILFDDFQIINISQFD